MMLWSKTAQLKVENLAQTTFRSSPIRYHAPQITLQLHTFEAYMHLVQWGHCDQKLGQTVNNPYVCVCKFHNINK